MRRLPHAATAAAEGGAPGTCATCRVWYNPGLYFTSITPPIVKACEAQAGGKEPARMGRAAGAAEGVGRGHRGARKLRRPSPPRRARLRRATQLPREGCRASRLPGAPETGRSGC